MWGGRLPGNASNLPRAGPIRMASSRSILSIPTTLARAVELGHLPNESTSTTPSDVVIPLPPQAAELAALTPPPAPTVVGRPIFDDPHSLTVETCSRHPATGRSRIEHERIAAPVFSRQGLSRKQRQYLSFGRTVDGHRRAGLAFR